MIECICPDCGETHQMAVPYWAGNIPARKLCKKCILKRDSYDEDYLLAATDRLDSSELDYNY